MTDPILRKKDYPLNYPTDVQDVITAMSFSKGNDVSIVGSMSLKSQQYAGDYDMIEEVRMQYKSDTLALQHAVQGFQHIVQSLLQMPNVYVGDIKAGIIPEWTVIPESAKVHNGRVVGFSVREARHKIQQLMRLGIVSKDEADEGLALLRKGPPLPPLAFLELRKSFKPQVVRWTPETIQAGFTVLPNGRLYSLHEAFASPAIVKLDVVAYVQQNRYTDFSLIYLLYNRGKALNPVSMDEDGIQQDLEYYYLSGNYFKALKRLFSIARLNEDTDILNSINGILNGDLGRLYSILSDIGTIQYLLEHESHLSIKKIQYELGQFRSRLGNVYTIKTPDKILEQLLHIEELPYTQVGRIALEKVLSSITTQLEQLLSKNAEIVGKQEGLFPLSTKYRA